MDPTTDAIPTGAYHWLTRDLDMHRAEVTNTSGYALFTTAPVLDGWWISREHSKQCATVDLTEPEALAMLATGKHKLAPGEKLRVDVPRERYFAREIDCSMEDRLRSEKVA